MANQTMPVTISESEAMDKNTYDKRKSISFDEILDAWLVEIRLRTKESTYVRYLHLVRTHIRPALGDFPSEELRADDIRAAAENWLAAGRLDGHGGLSAKTVSDMLALVKSVIAFAQDNGFCMNCRVHRLSLKKEAREMRVLSETEQARLVKFLLSDMDLYRFGILLALYTGLRIGELCALQWKDISFSPPMLTVRKTLQRISDVKPGTGAKTKIILTEPKSRASRREIPLPGFLAALAKKFRGGPDCYILSGKERYAEPRILQYHFRRYLIRCGIQPANFHALRHTFATRCVELGFEIKTLSEILGHSNVNTTLDRYVHSSFVMKRKNMSRLFLPENCAKRKGKVSRKKK